MSSQRKMDASHPVGIKRFDTKEFELPETVFIRDIDTRLLQGIVLQCLAKITGVAVIEGTFIDSIFGRGGAEKGASIHAEQDNKSHAVSIKVEVNIGYGVSIPQKAEEIQSKIVEEITQLTGLHVAAVHVVFRGLIPDQPSNALSNSLTGQRSAPDASEEPSYSDDF